METLQSSGLSEVQRATLKHFRLSIKQRLLYLFYDLSPFQPRRLKPKKASDEAPSGGDISPIHQFWSLLYTRCLSQPWTIDTKVLYISNAIVWIKHVIKHLDRNNSVQILNPVPSCVWFHICEMGQLDS